MRALQSEKQITRIAWLDPRAGGLRGRGTQESCDSRKKEGPGNTGSGGQGGCVRAKRPHPSMGELQIAEQRGGIEFRFGLGVKV
jgi:hypothetical protein